MKRRVAPYLALLVLLVLLTTLVVWAQIPAVRVPPSPLNRGLVAWWLAVPGFTQTNQLYDLMGQAHCTLINMAGAAGSGWAISTRAGGFMHLTLDGGDDYVDCSTPPILTDIRVRSVALWFYLIGWNVNNLSRLVDKRSVDGWTFALNNLNIINGLQWTQDFATTSGNWGLSGAVTVGVWTHVGVTYDSTTTAPPTFYLNGVAYAPDATFSSPTGAYLTDAASTFAIGTDAGATPGDRNTAGFFDDIRIWNRIVGADEMRQVYQQSQLRYLMPGQQLPELATMPDVAAPGRGQFFPFFH